MKTEVVMLFNKIKTALLGGALCASFASNAIVVDELFEGFWYRTDVGGSRGWAFDYIPLGPEKGLMFMAGYVYDDEGNPFWVVGSDEVLAGEYILNI